MEKIAENTIRYSQQESLYHTGSRKFKVHIKSKDLTNVNNPDFIIELIQLIEENPEEAEKRFSKPYNIIVFPMLEI